LRVAASGVSGAGTLRMPCPVMQRGSPMTRRERLRRCYFNEELDRPAVYSRTGFPKDDPTYDSLKAYLLRHTELKRG
jgi:hypothetical protein